MHAILHHKIKSNSVTLKSYKMETAVEKLTKWYLDLEHSELTFKVKHMMISNVKGEFKNFDIEIEGEDITNSGITLVVDTSSITTNSDQRDSHLRSADFFDVENYKVLKFKSTSFYSDDNENYNLIGVLTMKGISKEIILDVEFGGINTDPWGNEKAGFSVSGKINRKDWGLNWNSALESGGVLVSDEVRIQAEVQFIKQVEE